MTAWTATIKPAKIKAYNLIAVPKDIQILDRHKYREFKLLMEFNMFSKIHGFNSPFISMNKSLKI